MYADAILVRQFLRADAQLICVIENSPQPEPDLDAAVCRVMIFLQIRHLLLQLFFHSALPDGRKAVPAVHDRLGQLAAKPRFRRRAAHS